MKKSLLVLLLIISATALKAQLNISGEYRPRFEFRDGYKSIKTEDSYPAYFITQRTRLNLSHRFNNITSHLSVQDVRVWGESKLKSDNPGIGVFEAYFKLHLNDNWSISAGRQSLNIDNKRLFSGANWNQVSSSHDGITIDFGSEKLNFKMLTAFNQSKVSNFGTDYSDQISNYKFLNVIWLEKKFGNFSLANLSITDGYQKEGTTNTDYYRFTSGIVSKYKNKATNIEARGFYQMGQTNIGQDVNAYYLNFVFGQNLTSKFNITAGFEYMSGNDLTDSLNLEDNAFDILYGAKHSFNGIMDYFSTPNTTKNAGLTDLFIKLNLKNIKKWKISAQYHYLSLANDYIHENEKKSKFLANEIDLIATWKMNDIVNLQLGYATLFGSKTLELMKGAEADGMQHYFYTMITVKPTFFKK